ncbi:putative pre-rRna-processing protein [Cardiosporidium cionae]|uniref:Pre-rRna-processing protein n=1 Tax=Cardiosporidium cionae TaxID=476202 RepID=A0ABQ7J4N1_9APIC|nr:putative pre-rRna-processing protein [Cardiosporidium cionae]|eukprot:KAF8818517.1 putative pre-rRna-processing protein [Cardiosporidium cionae]
MDTNRKPIVEKREKRGVIYITSIPPYMGISKLRHYMEQFGDIGRIYLTPEDPVTYRKRRRAKGCKKIKYVDGWIEFQDRKLAKKVAEALNGQSIGGKKCHNFWRDDIWNIRYIPKFKWHNLTEHSVYKSFVRQERLRTQLSQVHRENQFYVDQVNKHKWRKQQPLNGSNCVSFSIGNEVSTQKSFDGFTVRTDGSKLSAREKNANIEVVNCHKQPSFAGGRRDLTFYKTIEASDTLLNAFAV